MHRWFGRVVKPVFLILLSSSLLVSHSYAAENITNVPPTVPPAALPAVPNASCPVQPVQIPLNKRLSLASLISLPELRHYNVGNSKIVQVTQAGLVIPLAKGSTKVNVSVINDATQLALGTEGAVTTAPSSCSFFVQIVDAIPFNTALKPKAEVRKVKVGSKSFTVQTVSVPKGIPVDLGLAGNAVGNVDHLNVIASKRAADAAINGTFFEAYGGIPEPWGTLIVNGELAHVSNLGTTIGFTLDGTAKMANLRVKIEGGTEGSYSWPRNWFAYFVNRTPTEGSNSSILFTPARGSRIGFAYGKAIVVKDGVVEKIVDNENVIIPRDGFVIVLNGSEKINLGARFKLGMKVHYRLKYEDAEGNQIAWNNVVTAIGAGPRVLKDGKIFIEAEQEGFKEAKILTAAAARSGIGIKADGSIVLVSVGQATIKELGGILLSIGAVQGMNLDGGASSGLYANGKLLTKPGRLISNSLLFGTQLKPLP
jgi:exopolysaccharide biosynthesis protein